MKSNLALVTILVIVLGLLSSCQSTLPPPSPVPPPPPEPVETEEATLPGLNVEPVIILVIDDFGSLDVIHPPNDLRELDESENCLVTPSGLAYTSSGFSNLDALAYTSSGFGGAISHGELVYDELQTAITMHQISPRTTPQKLAGTDNGDTFAVIHSWLKRADLWEISPGRHLLIVAVDTEGFTTQAVTNNIDEAISSFESGVVFGNYAILPAHRFVLNMSFGIVPCGNDLSLDDYKNQFESDEEIEDFAELLAYLAQQLSLADLPEEDLYTEVSHYLPRPARFFYPQIEYRGGQDELNDIQETYFSRDPLFNFLRFEERSNGIRAINVGAAGNMQGRNYPFAPALWDSVVSVSAIYDPACSAGSNAGEVQLSGHLTGQTTNCSLVGTSFAAPKMSFLAALHLLHNGTVTCSGAEDDSSPPLRYVELNNLSARVWQNLGLTDATNRFCNPFPISWP